tara:strand:+ start:778 stop:1014 length:237 start_codon:yes stop_codon:yes gene_type:complete
LAQLGLGLGLGLRPFGPSPGPAQNSRGREGQDGEEECLCACGYLGNGGFPPGLLLASGPVCRGVGDQLVCTKPEEERG